MEGSSLLSNVVLLVDLTADREYSSKQGVLSFGGVDECDGSADGVDDELSDVSDVGSADGVDDGESLGKLDGGGGSSSS